MRLKTDGNKVLWHNGKKWLVRDTAKTVKVAKKLKTDLEKQNIANGK